MWCDVMRWDVRCQIRHMRSVRLQSVWCMMCGAGCVMWCDMVWGGAIWHDVWCDATSGVMGCAMHGVWCGRDVIWRYLFLMFFTSLPFSRATAFCFVSISLHICPSWSNPSTTQCQHNTEDPLALPGLHPVAQSVVIHFIICYWLFLSPWGLPCQCVLHFPGTPLGCHHLPLADWRLKNKQNKTNRKSNSDKERACDNDLRTILQI